MRVIKKTCFFDDFLVYENHTRGSIEAIADEEIAKEI